LHQLQKRVYFPKNNNWIDFYSDKKYFAGTTSTVKTNENNIPTFVRGGSFIPMIKTIQNTTKYSLENFDLHYYFDEKTTTSNGKLYNDNGSTPNAYEKGEYEIINFNSTVAGKTITLKLDTEIGKSFISSNKNVTLKIHNIKPSLIFVDGKNSSFKTNKTVVEFQINLKKATEIKITNP
jgi:oligosaccharide 4-alpha-D-glucosyltransferase